MTNNVTIRKAKAADVISFYGGYPPYRLVGFVAEKEGKIIGVGGIAYPQGYVVPVLFSDALPEMYANKKTCAKAVRLLMNFMDTLSCPVYAFASLEIKTAPYLLAKIGFIPTGEITTMGERLIRYPRGD